VDETADRYRHLVELSPDGILILHDGGIAHLNPAARRLLGASTQTQLLGQSFVDLLQPEGQSTARHHLAEWLKGSATPPFEAQLVRLDSAHSGGPCPPVAVVDVEIAGAACPPWKDVHDVNDVNDVNRGNDLRGVQIVVRDITSRRRAEAALRESEERLTLAFAGAQEGVWDWNLETGVVVYSPRWKQMVGYADDEIEPGVGAWERLLHPEDVARARKVNDDVTHGAGTYEMEVRLRHKDGHYIDVLSRGYPVRRTPDGAVVRIVGTHLDLTERKRAEATLRESEERLTLAFAGAQEGVWDWNLETGAVVYSARWTEMLGYAQHEIQPHVAAWERLLHPDDVDRARQAHDRVAQGEPTYEGEFRLRHKDGHYVHVLSRGFPVRRQPGGPVVRIVGTHLDLTDRRRAEAERARTELLARLVFAQEDERRRIAREMHDQFGEELTALTHRIAALKHACGGSAEMQEHVAALEQLAQQLDRDVDQLVWELRPTALDDLGLRAALGNYIQDWSKRVGISVELHTSGLLHDRLPSETETTLYRIAQEALTNVARHSRAANVEVILERRRDHVLLIVEDDGVGFDVGEAAPTQGFGLLGMQERASLVGATLQIESAAGRGTTILVRMAAPDARETADREAADHV
jgi:PAS domain S-box-containing protein